MLMTNFQNKELVLHVDIILTLATCIRVELPPPDVAYMSVISIVLSHLQYYDKLINFNPCSLLSVLNYLVLFYFIFFRKVSQHFFF